MANHLPRSKQVAVLSALVEGASVRSVERMCDVSRETVLSLLVRSGDGCARLMDRHMRGIRAGYFELDEIWSFVAKKQKRVQGGDGYEVGDVWTYVALDAETKVIPCYLVGKRDAWTTNRFVADLRSRVIGRPQISTDGLSLYVDAVERAFGSEVDYGTIVKQFGSTDAGSGRYSPPSVTKVEKAIIAGSPDPKRISTSYVERSNLTTRMRVRRFTRLTNAFSKKLENHRAAVALHFAHYNFVAVHGSLRVTPAMAANVTQEVWSMEDLLDRSLAAYAETPF